MNKCVLAYESKLYSLRVPRFSLFFTTVIFVMDYIPDSM